MSVWNCPDCRVLYGPMPGNCCPICGKPLYLASIEQAVNDPARLTPVDQGTAIGSAEEELRALRTQLTAETQARQQAQTELAERIAAKDRAFKEFGHTAERKDGKCQCPYCLGDAEALAEMAAEYELQLDYTKTKLQAATEARQQAERELNLATDAVAALNDAKLQAERERDIALQIKALADSEDAILRNFDAELDKAVESYRERAEAAKAQLAASEQAREALRTALERAGIAIHSEYCGRKCHEECAAVTAAIAAGPSPDEPR